MEGGEVTSMLRVILGFLAKHHFISSNQTLSQRDSFRIHWLPSNKGLSPKGGVCPGRQFIRIPLRDHWQRILHDLHRPKGFLRAGIHRLVLWAPPVVVVVAVLLKARKGGFLVVVKDMEKEHMKGRRNTQQKLRRVAGKKKVRHQPFQSHSFLKTIVTSTPPVLGKLWTTHSLSSTTIAHETTFRLQKNFPLFLSFSSSTTNLPQLRCPPRTSYPRPKTNMAILGTSPFRKNGDISSNSIFGDLPYKSYQVFFGGVPGFAIITWNNPKKILKKYEKSYITKRQYLSIFRVDFPM